MKKITINQYLGIGIAFIYILMKLYNYYQTFAYQDFIYIYIPVYVGSMIVFILLLLFRKNPIYIVATILLGDLAVSYYQSIFANIYAHYQLLFSNFTSEQQALGFGYLINTLVVMLLFGLLFIAIKHPTKRKKYFAIFISVQILNLIISHITMRIAIGYLHSAVNIFTVRYYASAIFLLILRLIPFVLAVFGSKIIEPQKDLEYHHHTEIEY